jgi:hypothetical protein
VGWARNVERVALHAHLGMPAYVESDSSCTFGGEEDWWAYKTPSGETVAVCLPKPLVPSQALCAQPLIPALRPVRRAFKPFWPLALVHQALIAIIFASLHRLRGPALLHGLRPSPSPGAHCWPSGLTQRSSRPAHAGRLRRCVHLRRCSRSSWLQRCLSTINSSGSPFSTGIERA